MWQQDVCHPPHLPICSTVFQLKPHSLNWDSIPHLPAPTSSNLIGSLFWKISLCLLSMAEVFMSHLVFSLPLPSFRYLRLIIFLSRSMSLMRIFHSVVHFRSCRSGPPLCNGWLGENSHALRSVQSYFLTVGRQYSSMECNWHPAGNWPIMVIQWQQFNIFMLPNTAGGGNFSQPE